MSKKVTFLVGRHHTAYNKLNAALATQASYKLSIDLLRHHLSDNPQLVDAGAVKTVIDNYLEPASKAAAFFEDGHIEYLDGDKKHLICVTVTRPDGYLLSLHAEAIENKARADSRREARKVTELYSVGARVGDIKNG